MTKGNLDTDCAAAVMSPQRGRWRAAAAAAAATTRRPDHADGSTTPTTPTTPTDADDAAPIRHGDDHDRRRWRVSPSSVTIAAGGRVTMVNNHNRAHDMSSDPHPEHTQTARRSIRLDS